MIKFIYPDRTFCYRPMHTVLAIYKEDRRLLARVYDVDNISTKTFEISGFELIGPGNLVLFD